MKFKKLALLLVIMLSTKMLLAGENTFFMMVEKGLEVVSKENDNNKIKEELDKIFKDQEPKVKGIMAKIKAEAAKAKVASATDQNIKEIYGAVEKSADTVQKTFNDMNATTINKNNIMDSLTKGKGALTALKAAEFMFAKESDIHKALEALKTPVPANVEGVLAEDKKDTILGKLGEILGGRNVDMNKLTSLATDFPKAEEITKVISEFTKLNGTDAAPVFNTIGKSVQAVMGMVTPDKLITLLSIKDKQNELLRAIETIKNNIVAANIISALPANSSNSALQTIMGTVNQMFSKVFPSFAKIPGVKIPGLPNVPTVPDAKDIVNVFSDLGSVVDLLKKDKKDVDYAKLAKMAEKILTAKQELKKTFKAMGIDSITDPTMKMAMDVARTAILTFAENENLTNALEKLRDAANAKNLEEVLKNFEVLKAPLTAVAPILENLPKELEKFKDLDLAKQVLGMLPSLVNLNLGEPKPPVKDEKKPDNVADTAELKNALELFKRYILNGQHDSEAVKFIRDTLHSYRKELIDNVFDKKYLIDKFNTDFALIVEAFKKAVAEKLEAVADVNNIVKNPLEALNSFTGITSNLLGNGFIIELVQKPELFANVLKSFADDKIKLPEGLEKIHENKDLGDFVKSFMENINPEKLGELAKFFETNVDMLKNFADLQRVMAQINESIIKRIMERPPVNTAEFKDHGAKTTEGDKKNFETAWKGLVDRKKIQVINGKAKKSDEEKTDKPKETRRGQNNV